MHADTADLGLAIREVAYAKWAAIESCARLSYIHPVPLITTHTPRYRVDCPEVITAVNVEESGWIRAFFAVCLELDNYLSLGVFLDGHSKMSPVLFYSISPTRQDHPNLNPHACASRVNTISEVSSSTPKGRR